jgi:hypothetical protein
MSGDVADDARLRVLLWDVRVGGSRRLPLVERVDADVVLLLGVSRASGAAWSARWKGRYHCATGLQLASPPPQSQPHGAMIASRWPLRHARVVDGLPKPERGLIARLEHPRGSVRLVSWGTPNAAGEGRAAKEAAYALMTRRLTRLKAPVIVGVDTNAWEDPPLPGPDDDRGGLITNQIGFTGREPRHDLQDVYRVLVDRDEHRRRLLADLRPHGPLATTFVRRPHRRPLGIAAGIGAEERFGLDRMDRVYVSRDVEPLACEHLYHEARDAGGDHAAVVVDLRLP